MSRKLGALGVMTFFGFTTSAAFARADQEGLTLILSADRSDYYVGEPIRLSLTVRNDNDHEIYGHFRLWPPQDRIKIRYRRRGQPVRTLGSPPLDSKTSQLPNEVDTLKLPARIPPRQERRMQIQLVIDPVTREFVLDEPGDYEFWVECRLWPDKGNIVVRSETAVVRVASSRQEDRQAISDFVAGNLATLVETWPFPPPLQPESIASAAAFLDRHPRGPYSDEIREALVSGLRHRILRREATTTEKALYEKLKDRDREDPE